MKAIKIKVTMVLSWMLVTGVFAAPPWSDYKRVPGITYADQPTGIELSVYLATWPSLEPDIQRLRASQRNAVKADLQKRATSKNNSDGELNLLAQLQREDGALDQADNIIQAAIALRPNQFLHSFQQAMICFARLMRGSGMLEVATENARCLSADFGSQSTQQRGSILHRLHLFEYSGDRRRQ